nr:DUF2790 domain-containing protein [Pseudomonas aeruginosa]
MPPVVHYRYGMTLDIAKATLNKALDSSIQ